MVEYSEWLLGEVLKNVPHRQWVFSIPKRLRIYFLYDRKLLSKLSRCRWKVIRKCLETTSLDEDAKPGASIAVHTYGDFQMAPMITGKDLSEAFRHEVLSMLKKEGKITDAVIENMMSWHHSGFHVHIGERIWQVVHPGVGEDQQELENLARYIIRACFSQERMVYMSPTPGSPTGGGIHGRRGQGHLYLKERQNPENLRSIGLVSPPCHPCTRSI